LIFGICRGRSNYIANGIAKERTPFFMFGDGISGPYIEMPRLFADSLESAQSYAQSCVNFSGFPMRLVLVGKNEPHQLYIPTNNNPSITF